MKRLVRFIRTAGVLTLGLAAVPLLARAEATRGVEAADEGTAEHGGRDLIGRALDEVHLRPEQKSAVQKLKAEAAKRHAPVAAAKEEFLTVLADQVEKGKLDRCALAPAVKALASAKAAAHPGDRAAFEELHSMLDPNQRGEFVDALHRQWESVQKMHEPAALAERMAKDLKLSDDRKESLQKILTGIHEVRHAEPSYAAHRERWAKILNAFKGDHFVLDEIAPMGDMEAHSAARVERMLWAGEAILPVLDRDQRGVAADKLREHAKKAEPTQSTHLELDPSEED
jgi:hypothetical protein